MEVSKLTQSLGIDATLLEQLKRNSSEEVRVSPLYCVHLIEKMLLEKKGLLENERNQIAEALQRAKAQEEEEQQIRAIVESRLIALQQSICIGGVNIVDETASVTMEVQKSREEILAKQAPCLVLPVIMSLRLLNGSFYSSLNGNAKKIFLLKKNTQICRFICYYSVS